MDTFGTVFLIIAVIVSLLLSGFVGALIGHGKGEREAKKKFRIPLSTTEQQAENLDVVALKSNVKSKLSKIRNRIFGIGPDAQTSHKEEFKLGMGHQSGVALYPEEVGETVGSYDLETGIAYPPPHPNSPSLQKVKTSLPSETEEKALTIKDYMPSIPNKEQAKWFENYEEEKIVNDPNLINTYTPMSVPSSGYTVKNIYDLRESIPTPMISTYWNNTSKEPVIPRRPVVNV